MRLDHVAHALLPVLVAEGVVGAADRRPQEGLQALGVLGDGLLARDQRGGGHVEAQIGPRGQHAHVRILLLGHLADAGLVHHEERHRVHRAADERGRHRGRVHGDPRDRVRLEPGELLVDRPEDLVAVAGRDRELLALELLRALDRRVGAHEHPVGRPPVPERDGLHRHVGVGAGRDEGRDVRDADLALAGRDALDRVARALAAEDLHVESLVPVEALLERGVVRRVLAGGHEVQDERVGTQGLRLGPARRGPEQRDGQGEDDEEQRGQERAERGPTGEAQHGHVLQGDGSGWMAGIRPFRSRRAGWRGRRGARCSSGGARAMGRARR